MRLEPRHISQEIEKCWITVLSDWSELRGDTQVFPLRSRLKVYEDGVTLGPAHASHETIRLHGEGRYSHWDNRLYFSTSDDSDPRTNGREYSLDLGGLDPVLCAEVEDLAESMAGGGKLVEETVLSFLKRPTAAERGYACRSLSLALNMVGDNDRAFDFAQRAWALGERDEVIFDLLAQRLSERADYPLLWDVIRDATLSAEEVADPSFMAEVHKIAHESIYQCYRKGLPRMRYQDPVLIRGINSTFEAIRFSPRLDPDIGRRKIRVGYVMAGEEGADFCSLPHIVTELAAHHDRDRFSVTCFSFTAEKDVPLAVAFRDCVENAGGEIVFHGRQESALELASTMAEKVREREIDILVFTSQTGSYYLLAALRPAPVQVGLGLGTPDNYTSDALDAMAHFNVLPAIDGICRSEIVPAFMPSGRFRGQSSNNADFREEHGIAADEIVLMSTGRETKFREEEYWQLVAEVLEARSQCRLVVIGAERRKVPPFESIVPVSLEDRVIFLGWRNDVLDLLPAADIFIDTYPQGGGYSIIEAMNLCIPVVFVGDDYMRPYEERAWNPMGHYFPGLVVRERSETAMAARIIELADDPGLRKEIGENGREASRNLALPRRTAEALEALFEKLTEERFSGDEG